MSIYPNVFRFVRCFLDTTSLLMNNLQTHGFLKAWLLDSINLISHCIVSINKVWFTQDWIPVNWLGPARRCGPGLRGSQGTWLHQVNSDKYPILPIRVNCTLWSPQPFLWKFICKNYKTFLRFNFTLLNFCLMTSTKLLKILAFQCII